jgi:uncharacterized protein YgiM (DUF1202 family)
MKKIILIALAAVLLVNTVAHAQIGTVTYKVLLVRSGPSKKYKVVARMKRGQRPLIEDFRGDWVKLAWRKEAWVARSGLSLEQSVAQSSVQDEQFTRWLINDTKVNWAFVHRKGKDSISLWARMDSDRYGGLEGVKFIAQTLAQSYRFHTGETGPLKIKILKPYAKFNHEIYFQATFE